MTDDKVAASDAASITALTFNRLWSNPAFRSRLLFTLGALIAYRFARFIPLPGLDLERLAQFTPGTLVAAMTYSDFSARLSIVALSLHPYLTAWAFSELSKGWLSHRRAGQLRVGLFVLVAVLQAYGVALALQEQPGLVSLPGDTFRATTTASLAAGSVFLLWLGNEITRRGLGNGVWMLLAAEGLGALPALAFGLSEVAILGGRIALYMALIPLFFAGVTAMLVGLQLAVRRIPLERSEGAETGVRPPLELALPVDRVNILPSFFAAFVLPWLLVPTLTKPFWRDMFGHGQPAQLLLLALLVVLFTVLLTAIVASPAREAERLQRDGLVIQGVPPAETTVELDQIMSRTTLIAGLILAVNAVLPWALIRVFGWPVAIGGMQLLIGVVVAVGILRQMADFASDARPAGDDSVPASGPGFGHETADSISDRRPRI